MADHLKFISGLQPERMKGNLPSVDPYFTAFKKLTDPCKGESG
jgi:hypothetical protein